MRLDYAKELPEATRAAALDYAHAVAIMRSTPGILGGFTGLYPPPFDAPVEATS